MRINFRQGVVIAPANFVQASGSTVSLVIAPPEQVLVAIADGATDYLVTESASISDAWTGPFTPGAQDYWLYWDIDVRTGLRTFGHTLVAPVEGTTAPSSPTVDLHWFDTTNNQLKVFTGTGRWVKKLRVFAAKLDNGAVITSVSTSAPSFEGSQVAALQSTAAYAGAILYDVGGDPVKKTNNTFFTTEDEAVTGASSSARVKMESVLVEAVADGPIPAYGFVRFVDYNKVAYVTNGDMTTVGPYGLVQYAADQGDVVNVVMQGMVTNTNWDWALAGAPVNTPLYVNNNGVLTMAVTPNGVIVAYVVDKNTILMRPVEANSVSIDGVTSVGVSGGATGLTTSGGPITSAGTITLGGVLNLTSGGTGQTTAPLAFAALSPMTTNGDLITRIGGVPARLAAGADATVLTMASGVPSWQPAAGGGGVDVPFTDDQEPSALLLSEYRNDLYVPGPAIQENQIGYLWYDQSTPRPTLRQRMNSYAYSDIPTNRGMPYDPGAYDWGNQIPLPAPVPTLAEINAELDAVQSGVYWDNVFGGATWKLWYVLGTDIANPVTITVPLVQPVTPDHSKHRGLGYTVADPLSALTANIGGTGSGFSIPVSTILGGGAINTLDFGTYTPGTLYTPGVYRNVPLTGGTGTGARAHIKVGRMTGNTLVAGSLYVPGIYYNVPLTGGTGTGATAHITVGTFGVGNTVTDVTFVNKGLGYTIGDVLSASNVNLGGAGSGFSITVTDVGGSVTDVTLVTWNANYASWRELFDAIETAWPGSHCEFVETALLGRVRISHDTLEQFMLYYNYEDVTPADTQWLFDNAEHDEVYSAGGIFAGMVPPMEWGGARRIWNAIDNTQTIPDSIMQREFGTTHNSNSLMHDPISGAFLLNSGYIYHELTSGATRPTTIDTYANTLPFDSDPTVNQIPPVGYGSGPLHLATKTTTNAPSGDMLIEAGDTTLTQSFGGYGSVQAGATINVNAGGTYFTGNATALSPDEILVGGSILIRGGHSGVETASGYTYKLNPNNPIGTPPPNYFLGQFRGGDVELMAGGLIGSGLTEDGTRGYVKLTAGKVVLAQSHGVQIGTDDYYANDHRIKVTTSNPGHTMISRGKMGPARWAPTRSSESSYIPEGDSTNVFLQNFANTVVGTITTRTTTTDGQPYAGTNQRRVGFVSAAGAGSMASVRQTAALFTGGKFIYHARFMIPTDITGQRFFVGMAPAAAFTNVEPTTINNIVGLTCATSPTTGARQLVAVCNTSGTYSAVNITSDPDISMSTPQVLNWQVGEVYDLVIASTPFSHSLRVQRVSANTGTQSFPATVVFTSPTPANGLKLAPQIWISNNATASAVAIDVMFQHVNDNVTSF